MKIFAAALNLIALTSAVSLQAQKSVGEQIANEQSGQVFDACKGKPQCIVDTLGGMGLPAEVAIKLKPALEKDASKPDAKRNFQDAIFDMYKHVNVNNPAGVADGTAEFDMKKITVADLEAVAAAGNAQGTAADTTQATTLAAL